MKILRFTTSDSLPEAHLVAAGVLGNLDAATIGIATTKEIGDAARLDLDLSGRDRAALSALFNFLEELNIDGVFVSAE